jgi:fatty acid synthase subunit alpha
MLYSDGEIRLDTPFSRPLGKPSIMVAGMTPSTVKAGFISAVLDAGYHIELACGGHYNAAALRSKVAEIQKQIPAGVGITLNSLYINPHQFTFQLPLWQEMRKEGLPIEGFCVAAGIPTTEKAVEIIDGLKAAGIRHVAFKPGSVDGIRQVVNIAAANPDFPIALVDIILSRISTSQFWQPIVLSASVTTLASSPVLVSALQMMFTVHSS